MKAMSLTLNGFTMFVLFIVSGLILCGNPSESIASYVQSTFIVSALSFPIILSLAAYAEKK